MKQGCFIPEFIIYKTRFVSIDGNEFDTGHAGVAQLVERQPSKLNVASSNLVSRFFFRPHSSGVEHLHGKEGVLGSNPSEGLKIH